MGKTIKFLGSKKEPEYNGYDQGDGGKGIHLERGDELEVSDVKAAQVAEDFPHLFLVDGKKPEAPKGAPAPTPEADDAEDADETDDGEVLGDDPKAELLALDPDDLKARAEKLGLEGVGKGKLKSKAAIAEAILAKLAEQSPEA